MIVHGMYIWWKNRLRIFIDGNRWICPPQKCLRKRCPVVKLSPDFDISFSRIQGKGSHYSCAVHLIHISHQQCHTAILMGFCQMIHRHVCRWTVMLRPVKFDTTGNPRTGKSHQRRFDHMVIIYKIIIIRFVVCALDSSTKFRQDHNLQIFIFQIYCMPDLVFLFMTDFFCGRIRIYFS